MIRENPAKSMLTASEFMRRLEIILLETSLDEEDANEIGCFALTGLRRVAGAEEAA